VHAGLGFFLNGTVLSNNSIIMPSKIGLHSGGLYCLTDKGEGCCANCGVWRFPNGSIVGGATNADIYLGGSSLLLNRRSSAVEPTGVYTCLILDARDVLKTLKIGLYETAIGKLTTSIPIPSHCSGRYTGRHSRHFLRYKHNSSQLLPLLF
jgi:hypothetical protein